MPVNGAIIRKDRATMSDTRFGMVIVNRSENAAMARHKGTIKKIAAAITFEILDEQIGSQL
jgi:hypothetical protein